MLVVKVVINCEQLPPVLNANPVLRRASEGSFLLPLLRRSLPSLKR